MRKLLLTLSVLLLIGTTPALADQQIVSRRTLQPPVIDGNGTDLVWSKDTAVITQDLMTKTKVTLKSIHTNQEIFFLVRYPDPKEERQHKDLVWDKENELYVTGPKREDSFVIKWNMSPFPVDLTLSADKPYQADIWFWKAARTDKMGYADDKMQIDSIYKQKKAKKLLSHSG